MAAEVKREIALEIAHVLFIDIVAYSKMASDDQRAAIEKLNQIVQSTDEFRQEEAAKRLLTIATGDGMALIFYHSPEDPVECALEISRAIKEQHANLRVRMGVQQRPGQRRGRCEWLRQCGRCRHQHGATGDGLRRCGPYSALGAGRGTRTQQEQVVREQPYYAQALCALGVIDAMVGRKGDALSEGRRAMELLPIEKDVATGSEIAALFALICAWSGERELALRQLELVP